MRLMSGYRLDNLVTASPANQGTPANKGSPSNTLSYNFAVGGSTVDNNYARTYGAVNPFTYVITPQTRRALRSHKLTRNAQASKQRHSAAQT